MQRKGKNMTLFIDTHSEKIVVSIIDKTIITTEKITNHEHSKYTLYLINELLLNNNYKKNDIKEIIVVNGPGSFTGVRIGVVIAKTLSYSLNIPIKTITSLEAYGESESKEFDIICVKDSKGYDYMQKKGKVYFEPNYLKNSDFDKMIEENNYTVSYNTSLDIKKIYNYVKNKKSLNPNEVNPIYVKRIMNNG